MKEHIQAEMVNELRDVANKYAGCQCMRDVISGVVMKYIAPVREEISDLQYMVKNMKPNPKEYKVTEQQVEMYKQLLYD